MNGIILLMTLMVGIGGLSAVRSMFKPNKGHFVGGILWLVNGAFMYHTTTDETSQVVPLIVLTFTISALLFISSLRARFDNEK